MRLVVVYGRPHYRIATAPLHFPPLSFEGGHELLVHPSLVAPEGTPLTASFLRKDAVRIAWGPEVGLRLVGGAPVEVIPPPENPTPGILLVYVGEGPYLKMRVTGPTPGKVDGSRELFRRPNKGRMATPNGVWLLPPPPAEGLNLDFVWKWEEVGLRLFPEGIIIGPRAEVDRLLTTSCGQEEVL
jgi:hypothetical protein